jgi:hypothetical protein
MRSKACGSACLRFAEGSNKDIKEHFDAALAVMEAQGATLVDIEAFEPAAENFRDSTLPLLEYEIQGQPECVSRNHSGNGDPPGLFGN